MARLQAATTIHAHPAGLGFRYFWGAEPAAGAAVVAPARRLEPSITLISASQTGNARRVAEALRDDLQAAQLNVKLVNAGDYKLNRLPPKSCWSWRRQRRVKVSRRKKPSRCINSVFEESAEVTDTAFAVFGLGDTSYEFFCQSGKDLIISWPNWAVNACSTGLMLM